MPFTPLTKKAFVRRVKILLFLKNQTAKVFFIAVYAAFIPNVVSVNNFLDLGFLVIWKLPCFHWSDAAVTIRGAVTDSVFINNQIKMLVYIIQCGVKMEPQSYQYEPDLIPEIERTFLVGFDHLTF